MPDGELGVAPASHIHILRHGQSLHNVDKSYRYRDPPLTDVGTRQACNMRPAVRPDLILVSPMTRTIQTAQLVFGELLAIGQTSSAVKLEIWPDLREAHDAICNQGVTRAELAAKFPSLDFSECHESWDYQPHSFEDAAARAERVRERLKSLASTYKNIVLVSHRGFIAFLVQGARFDVCDYRSYQFAADEQVRGARYGINVDYDIEQDFGPSLLLPTSDPARSSRSPKHEMTGRTEWNSN